MYHTTFVAAEILLHRDQKQQGTVLKVHVFFNLGYGMLYHLIQESQTLRGGARKSSWGGVSGLELPSTICELKCYKPKLLHLFSNHKPNVFQMQIIDREALLKYKSIDILERYLGVWGLALRKIFYTNLLWNVRKCPLRSRKGFFVIDQDGKYDPILQSTLHEYGRQKVLILKVDALS